MVTFIPTSATSDTNSLVTPPLSVSTASSLSFDPKRFEAIDNLIHLKEQVSTTQVTVTSTSAPLTQDSVDSISSLPLQSLTSSSESLLGHDRSISDGKVTDLISNTNQIELQTPNASSSSLPDEQSQSACIGISHILTAAMNIEAMELSGEKRKRWKKPAKTVKQRFFLSPSAIDDSSDDDSEVEELVSATGRPKRKSTHNVSYEIKYDVKEEPVKKRGRGRPRKTPLKENDGNANVTTKRGRGRPRKTPLKEVDTNAKNKSSSGNNRKNSKKKVNSKTNSKKGKLTSFDQRVNELANFKRKHGHMDVPSKYGPNQQLSNFCQNFRYSYGMHKRGLKPIMLVNDERIEKLKAIGFDFKNEATSA
ncbi:hypothetical protein CTEN210_16309 [Chaetoceros tenuissimus]|uniref:Helicase-associated domain-containing protein n=1 Tax=Chaetoceros tenuissimus TaxID=426638 RepID=A0AAD3D8S4_9STRA|nr:hypothetical protein CTEN210_16309 [Chaetoceros tenuissimus]